MSLSGAFNDGNNFNKRSLVTIYTVLPILLKKIAKEKD